MKALTETEVALRTRVRKALSTASRACNELAKKPKTQTENLIFADYQRNLIAVRTSFITQENKVDAGILPLFPFQTMRILLREQGITTIGHFLDTSLIDIEGVFESYGMEFPLHITHLHPNKYRGGNPT